MNRERTQNEIHDTCEKACAILKKTNDGDMLDPSDLKLTELAVNGYLNDEGREVFEKLYKRVVVDETYIKPYLHDIEHFTRDHEGYIYYKGIHVDHYDRDYVSSKEAENSLLELKRRCEFLERKGIEVSNNSVVWGWGNYEDEYSVEKLKELSSYLKNCSLQYSQVEIYNSGREYKYFTCGTPPKLEEVERHPVTRSMIGRYFDDEYEITVKNFVYFNGKDTITPDKIQNTAEVESLLLSCHDYILKNGISKELSVITHKTDFAEGYEKTKLLDNILDSPDRSLQYSEVFMYGYGLRSERLYICGTPTFDDIKESYEYQTMLKLYGDGLNVSVATFQYGDGDPLNPEEIPDAVDVAEMVGESHYYLRKHDLAVETSHKIFKHDFESLHESTQLESEYEVDDGYEP